jgi:hypothetical protein
LDELDFFDQPNPFSSPLFLPFQTMLNAIIEKFVSVHLVKCVYLSSHKITPIYLRRRYPLIFGLWCKVGLPQSLHIDITYLVLLRNLTWRFLPSHPLLARYPIYWSVPQMTHSLSSTVDS